jgi:phosphatidylserine synthase 2
MCTAERACRGQTTVVDALYAGPARCLQSLLVVCAFLAVEVNVFFLKYALWVPPTNPLNTARLVLWLLVGAPAVREYYEFIEVRGWPGWV